MNIAELIGTSRETLTRALTGFKQKHIVELLSAWTCFFKESPWAEKIQKPRPLFAVKVRRKSPQSVEAHPAFLTGLF
jgi:hypothetical protein